MDQIDDIKWMKLAIKQAKLAKKKEEVPVGAILIKDNKLIASAHNQPITTKDPTAHAEIQLLRLASKKLNNYRLPNTTMYVTLEPCIMCLGAIMQARIEKIVFGTNDEKTGACGSCIDLTNSACFNHLIKIKNNVLQLECKQLLTSFFKELRKK
jgi:tRNA(adenine34) deaminase